VHVPKIGHSATREGLTTKHTNYTKKGSGAGRIPCPTPPIKRVESLAKAELGVAKAWYIKELFRHFWTRRDANFARSFFDRWYKEAYETGLPEIRKVARMLKKHLGNILTYFESYITNAASEGLNSKIQAIKANARGFRNFENYRISILFFCGKLELSP